MRSKKWRRFMKRIMESDTKELERVLKENPELQNAKAPDYMYDRIMNEIHAYEEKEAEKERTRQEQELIRLGTIYKRRKKWDKYVVLLAALVAMLAFGITSVGGPKRILEEVKWFLAGGEQSNIDTDDERVNANQATTEQEAYEQIEKTFGFSLVRLYYIPKDIEFTEVVIEEETQTAKLYYEGPKQEVIRYRVITNNRTSSTGTDIEDKLVSEYRKLVNDTEVIVKKYLVEENQAERWQANFAYQGHQYSVLMMGIEESEVEKIIENLYFL